MLILAAKKIVIYAILLSCIAGITCNTKSLSAYIKPTSKIDNNETNKVKDPTNKEHLNSNLSLTLSPLIFSPTFSSPRDVMDLNTIIAF